MKYFYPASMIDTDAAFEETCSRRINKYDSPVANRTKGNSTFLKLNIKNHEEANIVGIKFDNILARKYFALIHYLQRTSVRNRATEKSDDLLNLACRSSAKADRRAALQG